MCRGTPALFWLAVACLMAAIADASSDISWHGGSSSSSSSDSGGPARQLQQNDFSCNCPKDKKPVCSTDGQTFDNWCQAECAGADVDHVGACGSPNSGSKVPGCSCAGATYQPVCGRNGKTYANACEAGCEMTDIVSLGACTSASIGATPTTASSHAEGCVCPQVYKPVCTHVGVTQFNECTAACLGQRIVSKGVCPVKAAAAGAQPAAAAKPRPPRQEGCVCAANFAPVCGTDGNTYSNACEASCYLMSVAQNGQCPPPPASGAATAASCGSCPEKYDPVCGSNGVTYLNECKARCQGRTSVAYKGSCKPAGSDAASSNAALVACLSKCPTTGKQLCTTEGQTYVNTCIAQCYKATIAYPGPCKDACAACPNDWKPYCVATSAYGPRTYANCCYAKCNGIKILSNVLYAGGCTDTCKKCDTRIEKPLCCSGRTYKNGCLAICNGEDTGKCAAGRCSTVSGVDTGLACLLGACPVKCSNYAYNSPVCGSDGKTYPDKCALMCNQEVAIVANGKCGTCAPNQPGGFPFCSESDSQGYAPVCGTDNITYRNSYAAKQAGVSIQAGGSCDNMCGEPGEACFANNSSTCCDGLRCSLSSAISAEGTKVATGVCVR